MNNQAKIKQFTKTAIGVPFADRGRSRAGWDCWGLVVALYKECFGISLPEGTDYTCADPKAAGDALAEGSNSWVEVEIGKEKPGDVILVRPCHAGLIVERAKMLNCCEEIGTVIERYDNSIWKRRIIGIYRHAELA